MAERRMVLGFGAAVLSTGMTSRARAQEQRPGARPGHGAYPSLLRHEPGELFFTGADGRAIYLAGIHTWPASQDRGPPFDWPGFLDLQERIGGNLIRMWGIDGEDDHSVRGPTHPLPFARKRPGGAGCT